MPRSAEPAFTGLRVSGIACERGGKRLFGPLEFTLDRGAVLFVLGPNGCGKSTLLRTLAGLTEPLSASVHWGEAPVRFNSLDWRSQVTYLGHRLGLKEELTVAENLVLAARLDGGAPRVSAHAGALARLGLNGRERLPVKRLSQGQKQRLALARLCLSARPVWLLDEPSAALDTHAKDVLAGILDEHLRAQGIAIVATHDTLDVCAARATNLRLA